MKWLALLLLFALPADKNFKIVYQVEAQSRLFLNGSTSVNTFQCYCNDNFPVSTLTGTVNENTKVISFNNAKLLIKTTLMNCKNKLMNRDMHKALKADDFPYTTVLLTEATPLHNSTQLSLNNWYNYKATVYLTIAGITKQVIIPVQINKLSPHLFRFIASKELLMSDFNVKPRTPLNMIRIDDMITINFDMTVIINEN